MHFKDFLFPPAFGLNIQLLFCLHFRSLRAFLYPYSYPSINATSFLTSVLHETTETRACRVAFPTPNSLAYFRDKSKNILCTGPLTKEL